MISRMKYTKNVLVGSPAVVVRDEIHCNKYPGTRRVMNVGYPGSKISTRFVIQPYNLDNHAIKIQLLLNKSLADCDNILKGS